MTFSYKKGFYIDSYLIAELTWSNVVDEVRRRKQDVKEAEIILATATDGNHGYGVAWISSKLNIKSFIYMPQVG